MTLPDHAGQGALTGKIIVMVGASRGVGRFVSGALAEAGANIVMIARNSELLASAAAEIGPQATPIAADVTSPDSVRAAFREIKERFGRIDALINNAVVGWPHLIEDVDDADLLAEVATNFVGPILTCRSAIPLLRAAGGGDIINVSSESVLDPFPHLVVYAATKAGLETFSTGLAGEVKADGIRVALLRSGHTAGGEFSAHWDPDAKAKAVEAWEAGGYLARVAGHEPQPPERIAEAIIFLITRPQGSMVDVISVRAQA
jgi:meso-butanediol dehydrogenase/(S,S)-butanediol dehydrogenase/diacetyl reductase